MPFFDYKKKIWSNHNLHDQEQRDEPSVRPSIWNFNNSLKLSTRFLLVIFPLLIAIFVTATYLVYNKRRVEFSQQLKVLEDNFQNINLINQQYVNRTHQQYYTKISSFLMATSRKAMVDKDLTLLRKHADLIRQYDKTAFVAFYDTGNNPLVSAGVRSSSLHFKKMKIKSGGKQQGTLILGFTKANSRAENQKIKALTKFQIKKMQKFLQNAQTKNTYAAIISMILILMTIALAISFLFNQFITIPLQKCISLIKRFQSKDYDAQIPYQEQKDEIGEIARTLDAFRTSLLDIERLEKEKASKNLQLIEARAEAERLAYTDDLTGLPNKACCQLDASAMLSNSSEDTRLSILYLDLNDVKKVNDTLGHAAGDCLLLEVSKNLSSLTSRKQNSQVYRWGGDEFIIIYDQASGPIEKFCDEVKRTLHHQVQYGTSTLWPSSSIGIANYPEDGENFEELMICADLALHRAQSTVRDGYCFFTKDLKQKIDEESRIEGELRVAIENRELFMVFQPQIDSKTLEVKGMEALIRWNHPERGILSPIHFLDVVENSRLAPVVGRYVFNEAFRAARYWLDNDIHFGRISVNLSPQHLKQGALIEDIKNCMQKNNLTPDYVTVEILESLLIDEADMEQNDFIEDLNKIGVKIELDDFGTGYASLAHLSTLAIDGLKIDRSFTKMLMLDPKKTVVIQSLVSLCKLLQIDLVCEGVETWPQMEKLRSFGTCSLQGYLIAKPLDFEAMTNWLQEEKNYNFLKELDIPVKSSAHK